MAKKILKFVLWVAGIAAAVAAGLVIYKKFFELDDDFDDDDFDDFDEYNEEDFEPVKREYVPITLDKDEDLEAEEVEEAEEAEETSEEETEE